MQIRYTEESAREVMKKLLSAVSYLHANNIIHRDLKPENILLVSADNDTNIMLTDFGLAKKANQEGLKTFCGTPQYFAPEVCTIRAYYAFSWIGHNGIFYIHFFTFCGSILCKQCRLF